MALSVGMTTTGMCLYGSMSLSVCVVVARPTRTCTFAQLTSRLSTATTTCCLILLQLLPAALDEPAFRVLLCAQLLPMLLMLCMCHHMASVWLFHIYFIICCGLHFQQGHCAIIMIFTYNHTFSKHIYGYLFLMFSFDRIIVVVVLLLLLIIIIHLMCIMTDMRTDGQTDT